MPAHGKTRRFDYRQQSRHYEKPPDQLPQDFVVQIPCYLLTSRVNELSPYLPRLFDGHQIFVVLACCD